MKLNDTIYLDEFCMKLVDAGRKREEWVEEVKLTHPVHLGIIHAVKYDPKVDRYVALFGQSSAKLIAQVAEYLLMKQAVATGSSGPQLPDVYAHMTEGAIDGVVLVFVTLR